VRQTRSAADKLRILQEYEAYPAGSPERGALLRREGIYTSHISKWRKQRDRAAVAGLSPQRRGPKPAARHPLEDEVERLRTENARLQARLSQAETIIAVQKKLARLLGETPATE
jgi:transposase-like protein